MELSLLQEALLDANIGYDIEYCYALDKSYLKGDGWMAYPDSNDPDSLLTVLRKDGYHFDLNAVRAFAKILLR